MTKTKINFKWNPIKILKGKEAVAYCKKKKLDDCLELLDINGDVLAQNVSLWAAENHIDTTPDSQDYVQMKMFIPPPNTRPQVPLVGEDGNALSIIGRCMRAARRAGWTLYQREIWQDLAMAGDYDNVLCCAMEYFDEPHEDEDEDW